MSAALYTLVRYLVAAGAAALAQHGWTVASADGATLDAVTQLVIGAIGVVVPAGIGVMTSSVNWALARLQRHHASALLDAAASVPGVTRIEATPQLAAATASPAVVATPAAGGA